MYATDLSLTVANCLRSTIAKPIEKLLILFEIDLLLFCHRSLPDLLSCNTFCTKSH